jgi:LacI family transcriptional regulator
MRITLKDVAAHAGVSVVTVDRVINGRAVVAKETAALVIEAARALNYRASPEILTGRRPSPQKVTRCGFLLPNRDASIYRGIADELHRLTNRRSDPIEVHIEFTDSIAPETIARQMLAMANSVDVLAIVAVDHNYVAEATATLRKRDIPVIALLSDLSPSSRAGYVGINNRMAGRTAAWAFARCAPRAGAIAVLIGSHGYLGHEEREIGLRSYFREKDLPFTVLEPLVYDDDPELLYRSTLGILDTSENLVGIYSIGGGDDGAIRAVSDRRPAGEPMYICHDLTPNTRKGLITGTVDLIFSHDLEQIAREALAMMRRLKGAEAGTEQCAITQFLIHTSENA